jgi:hypothetical protein
MVHLQVKRFAGMESLYLNIYYNNEKAAREWGRQPACKPA